MSASPDFTNADWHKSNTSEGGACVEVAHVDGFFGVRDTKDAGKGPTLIFNEQEWTAFLKGVANQEFTKDNLSR